MPVRSDQVRPCIECDRNEFSDVGRGLPLPGRRTWKEDGSRSPGGIRNRLAQTLKAARLLLCAGGRPLLWMKALEGANAVALPKKMGRPPGRKNGPKA